MKIILATLALLVFSSTIKAQEASVEPSILGLQSNILGFTVYKESRLNDKLSLRIDAGFGLSYLESSKMHGTRYSLSPSISVAPRYFYNLDKRLEDGNKIERNSGSYLSVIATVIPYRFWGGNSTIAEPSPYGSVSLIPTWAFRRAKGQHFNYELGLSLGGMMYDFGSKADKFSTWYFPFPLFAFGYDF